MKLEKKLAIQKAIMGQSEKVDTALNDQPIIDILAPNFMEGSIYELCNKINVTSNNGITLPRYDTSRATDLSFFGARAYWVDEGEPTPDSKIQYDNKVMPLRKVIAKIPATNEIIQDVDAMVGYINTIGVNSVKYQLDRAVIYGLSQFAMGGVCAGGDEATVYVAGTGTWAGTGAKMVGSYYGGSKGVWVMSQDIWAALVTEHQNDFLLDMFEGKAYFLGYPVFVCSAAKDDCLILGDFSQYTIVQKELRKEISEHVLFDSDQSVIKIAMRVQGAPIWSSPVTLENGSVVAPFVALNTMEYQESSEEWEQSSSSSSNSSSSSSSSSSSEGFSSSSSSSSEGNSSSSSSSSSDSTELSSDSSESSSGV